jgi:putative inorganic carbon (HCO3(-)) transporter
VTTPALRLREGALPSAALIAVGLVALAGFTAVLFSVAASQDGVIPAAAVIAAPIFLVLAAARAWLPVAAMAAFIALNAGDVLSFNHDVPSVVKATLLLAALGFLARASYRGAMLRRTPIVAAVLLFASARLLSALPVLTDDELTKLIEQLLIGLAIVLVVSATGASRTTLRITALAAFSAVALLSVATVLGIGGELDGFSPLATPTGNDLVIVARGGELADLSDRLRGPVDDPNFWAQSLLLVLPIGIWWARTAPSRWQRAAAVVGSLAIAGAIFQTGSRGGLLALMVAAVLMMALAGGRARKLAVLVPVLGVIALIVSGQASNFSSLTEITNPTSASDESVQGRYSENLVALRMFRDHPVVGVGPGLYPANYASYARDIGIDERVERQPHNSYLEMAAESGAPGAITFLAMIVIGLVVGVRARARAIRVRDRDLRLLAEALLTGFAAYAVAAIFLHQAYPYYLWLALGFLGAVDLLSRRAAGEEAPAPAPAPSFAPALPVAVGRRD